MTGRFQLSDQTKQMIDYLRAFNKGAQVSYGDLSQMVAAPIDARSHKLIYARRVLQRDHNQVWVCIRPRVGLRRLTDPEIAERLPGFWLSGARHKLRRGGDQADVVELKALDIDQQARFGVDCIQRELAFEALSKATRRKMERVARGTSNDLPSFTAIEWAISLSPQKRKPR